MTVIIPELKVLEEALITLTVTVDTDVERYKGNRSNRIRKLDALKNTQKVYLYIILN